MMGLISYLICKLLACLFDSNCYCNSHTNHGVITCADESHHLYIPKEA